ncbi:MAG: hypothetical protein ACP5RJ_09185, partial [Conexivisphaera sp.]
MEQARGWWGIRLRPAVALLAAAYATYTAVWSCISLLRLFSLNAFVLDLGVNMQFAWDAVLRATPGSVLRDLALKGIVYAVAPVFL